MKVSSKKGFPKNPEKPLGRAKLGGSLGQVRDGWGPKPRAKGRRSANFGDYFKKRAKFAMGTGDNKIKETHQVV